MARTYEHDVSGWREIEAALPAALRASPDRPPLEERVAIDGLDVHVDRHAVADSGTIAVLLHGGGGHGRLLAPLGRLFQEAGVEAIAPDLPGYGLTDCPPDRMRYPLWVRTAAALIEEAGRERKRTIVCGLSMGGMLAVHAVSTLRRGQIDVVIASTLLDPRTPEVRRKAGRLPLPPPALMRPFDRVRLPVKWVAPIGAIANDPAVARAIARDAQSGGSRPPSAFWRSWLEYEPPVALEDFDHAPVILAHPTDDRWTPTDLSLRSLARLGTHTSHIPLTDGGHYPAEPRAIEDFRKVIQDVCDQRDRSALR